MTQIWWVRHGPTHAKTLVGWRDVPADLSDTGTLSRLADHLPQNALIGSSDLVRSIATADAIAAGRQRLAPSHLIREFHFGQWDGLPFPEISERWPDLSRAYWETPGDISPPDGESWNTALSRVNAYVETLLSQHKGRDLVLVAHFGIILTQYAQALGITPDKALAQRIDPLSVTRIDLGSDGPSLVSVNHVL